MSSRFVVTTLLASAVSLTLLPPSVEAAACAQICYTTVLTGFGPGGTPGCTCSGSQQGARTGAGGCNCGQCYEKTNGAVYGFAINANGTCTYGTDCGNCDYSSTTSSPTSTPSTDGGSQATTSTPSPVPSTSTATPTVTDSASGSTSSTTDLSSSSNSASDSSANTSTNGSTSTHTGSSSNSISSSSSHDNASGGPDSRAASEAEQQAARGPHLSMWQIVLAICCSVLFFAVAVVSVCSCYCKARSRLYQHEEDVATYYSQNAAFQPWSADRTPAPHVHVLQATKSSNMV
ncbi:hypothetical protein PHYSODRAFT_296595 [Phytophthora sojae]|uniref:Uncharacterized protein n=1 Tax=Phytophthora sojae (strain P6497) TaxID=1094619 RepID=G4YYG9_PHYSP|nr:hypothetical protein PHYSODRAFT_296595 [Phytophthora sojae]EGZ24556.1 hypothetical protein PHYSODRAFT_296595 [Phytophthora sojae]|eukprot:XP_009519844.1 hypothetical protein PHYSODRAFT_296595 [Phytophthora sojae]